MSDIITDEYKQWLEFISDKIKSTQIKIAVVANLELIEFNWWVGRTANC